MATEKLYYADSHMREFDAMVLSCEASKHGYEVILDRTCFYPEGGGQPGDTGSISGVRVYDTHEKNGEVIHYCEHELPAGSHVHAEIDFDRRFEFMQLHSGEHVLSGLIHERFGYDNVGFHMGADFVTIDFSGMISEEDLLQLEQQANEAVWNNLPIEVTYPTSEELPHIGYRSKKELSGWVRIVTIPGIDCCACCGTHVSATGEIGLIKIFSCVKFHDGVRMEILCGRRAMKYMRTLIAENKTNSGLLSAKPEETSAAVRRMIEETAALKMRCAKLEDSVFASKASEYTGLGNVILFEDGLAPDALRKLADAVMDTCGGRAAVFSGTDQTGYKYAVGESRGDIRTLVRDMNTTLGGRGGGKPFFAQGSVTASRSEIEEFFKGR